MSMRWSEFQTRASGKWVLAGEHSVLRGATAVALPHPEFSLTLKFIPENSKLEIDPPTAATVISEILDSVHEDYEKESVFESPRGRLEIRSTIPIGAGLGSSAALCVAMSRWLAEPLGLGRDDAALFEFATRLEHRFHGRSSGMDVAVISAGEPVFFTIQNGAIPLGIQRLPKFTFHDTGLRCRTSECVVRVEKMREEDPILGHQIDEKMGASCRLATEGLVRYDSQPGGAALDQIARAMKLGQECFYSWQLVPGAAKRLEEDLFRQGALAVKLTGAGGGGMLVALWDK